MPYYFVKKSQKIENFLGKNLNLGFLYIGIGKKTGKKQLTDL